MLGDIVICPQFTSAQAPENGREPAEELEYLLIHGLLHLLGHDHAEPGAGRHVQPQRPDHRRLAAGEGGR